MGWCLSCPMSNGLGGGEDTALWHAVGLPPAVPSAAQPSLQRLQVALLFHLTCRPLTPEGVVRSLVRYISVIETYSGAYPHPACPVTLPNSTLGLTWFFNFCRLLGAVPYCQGLQVISLTIDTWICRGVISMSMVSRIHHHLL